MIGVSPIVICILPLPQPKEKDPVHPSLTMSGASCFSKLSNRLSENIA